MASKKNMVIRLFFFVVQLRNACKKPFENGLYGLVDLKVCIQSTRFHTVKCQDGMNDFAEAEFFAHHLESNHAVAWILFS